MSTKTEWDANLEKFGIKEKEPEITEDSIINMIEQKVERSRENRLEDKTNEELDDMEDNLDDEEEKIIQRIREQRLSEMKAKLSTENFGYVIEVSKSDWKTQINEAGSDVWVVVHIYGQGNILCNKINDALNKLAMKFKSVKFVKGLSETCIPNYPAKNIPTLIIYKNGEVVEQWIGSAEFAANKFTVDYLEWKLSQLKVVESSLKSNPIKKDLEVNSSGILIGRRNRSDSEEDENDW